MRSYWMMTVRGTCMFYLTPFFLSNATTCVLSDCIGHQSLPVNSIDCGAFGMCLSNRSSKNLSLVRMLIDRFATTTSLTNKSFLLIYSFSSSTVYIHNLITSSSILFASLLLSRQADFCAGVGCCWLVKGIFGSHLLRFANLLSVDHPVVLTFFCIVFCYEINYSFLTLYQSSCNFT